MHVHLRSFGGALLALVAAASIATGCGDSSSSDSGGNGGGGDAKPAAKQDLVVNAGKEAEPGQFIPAAMTYLDALNTKGYLQFAGLYGIEGENSDIVPQLATSAPKISADGLTYEIEMRDDAKWSDDKPIVAADVVTAVQYALDPKVGNFYASFLKDVVGACERLAGTDKAALAACPAPRTDGSVGKVGVVATDDTHLKITLNRPVPWFEQLLTIQLFNPLRQDQMTKLGDKYGEDPSTIASGPFKIKEYKQGDHWTFVKNPSYYDADEVKLDSITFRNIAEASTATREFERGKLDTGIQNQMFDAADVDRWKADDRFTSSPTVGNQYMWMNTTNKELSDPKVRQALALAIDRRGIVDNIRKLGDTPANTVVPDKVPGNEVWSEGAQDFLPSDGKPSVDKARSLLEEAGWDENTTLDLYYPSGSSNAPAIAEQVQGDLSQVGVKVDLKPTGQDTFSTQGIGQSPTDPKVDLMLQGWIQDYLDAQDWYQLFISDNVEGGLNSANYQSKEFDRIYNEAIKTVDNDARFELYKQLEAKLTGPEGDMPAAPLYVQADATLVQPWVKGFKLVPSGMIDWSAVYKTDDQK